jgi:RNA polymerase nonessential primary-like sigma factor
MNKQMTMDEEDVIEDDVVEPELNEEQDSEESQEEAEATTTGGELLSDVTQIYLNDIGHNALLTPDQERELARRVVMGDFEARQKMIEHNLRLVVNIAKITDNK